MTLFGSPYLFAAVMVVATGIAIYEFLQTRKVEKTHSRRRSCRDSSSYPEVWRRDSSTSHVTRRRPSNNPSSTSSSPYTDIHKSAEVKSSKSDANTTYVAEVKQNTCDAAKECVLKSEEIKTENAAGKQNICDSNKEIPKENAYKLSGLKTEEKPKVITVSNSKEFFNEPPSELQPHKEYALEPLQNNEYTSESQSSSESTSELQSREERLPESQPGEENIEQSLSDKVHASETEFCKEGVLEQLDVTKVTAPPKQQDNEIPTQLNPVNKKNSLCRCCEENPVSTIVLPCNHLYTCNECAPIFSKKYDNCIVCRKIIDSYKSV